MANRRVVKAIASIRLYSETAFCDNKDIGRFVDALRKASQYLEEAIKNESDNNK